MRPNWPYFSWLEEGEGGRREVKAKHEKRGHFGRFFHARNEMGIRQVPKHEKCGRTGRMFRVWMRVRVRVRSSMKTRPFRPRFSRRGWGRMREERKNAKAKHDKRGHFGRVFHAWNGRGYEFG